MSFMRVLLENMPANIVNNKNHRVFNRIIFDKIFENIKLFYRNNIFASKNILKNIDYSSGVLNY